MLNFFRPSRSLRPAHTSVASSIESLESRIAPASLTFSVTNANDSGPGSLRQAILDANGHVASAPDTIVFKSALEGKTILLLSDLPQITDPLDIVGRGQDSLTISGGDAFRVFDIAPEIPVTITKLTIAHGDAGAGEGGAIQNAGSLNLNNVVISASHATEGGAVANLFTGTANISDSEIVANRSDDFGGGLANDGGSMTVVDTTVEGNVANVDGGGLGSSGGSLKVQGCTISGNLAFGSGGGVEVNSPTASIVNSTIVRNIAEGSFGGGGVMNAGGTLDIVNSTIVGNADTSGTGHGGIVKTAGTLNVTNTVIALNAAAGVGDSNVDASGLDTNVTNFIGGNPQLGPLQDNGAPTLTMAPLPGSPLIDAGTNQAALADDQRGYPRTIDGNGDATATTDIGATEFLVSGAHIFADPQNPGHNYLLIVGTGNDDIINVTKTATETKVKLNGVASTFPNTSVERIVAFGLEGEDRIAIQTKIAVPTVLDGGANDDVLIGGNGDDLLIGGTGDDHLTGNRGNNFLVGGTGKDHLIGGAGNDILVGGETIYDRDQVALGQILAAWSATSDYATRVANLTTPGLAPSLSQIAITDHSTDTLSGAGGLDVFFFDTNDHDALPGKAKAELSFPI